MSDLTKTERIYHRQRHFETVVKMFNAYLKSDKSGGWDEIFPLVKQANELLIEEQKEVTE